MYAEFPIKFRQFSQEYITSLSILTEGVLLQRQDNEFNKEIMAHRDNHILNCADETGNCPRCMVATVYIDPVEKEIILRCHVMCASDYLAVINSIHVKRFDYYKVKAKKTVIKNHAVRSFVLIMHSMLHELCEEIMYNPNILTTEEFAPVVEAPGTKEVFDRAIKEYRLDNNKKPCNMCVGGGKYAKNIKVPLTTYVKKYLSEDVYKEVSSNLNRISMNEKRLNNTKFNYYKNKLSKTPSVYKSNVSYISDGEHIAFVTAKDDAIAMYAAFEDDIAEVIEKKPILSGLPSIMRKNLGARMIRNSISMMTGQKFMNV